MTAKGVNHPEIVMKTNLNLMGTIKKKARLNKVCPLEMAFGYFAGE